MTHRRLSTEGRRTNKRGDLRGCNGTSIEQKMLAAVLKAFAPPKPCPISGCGRHIPISGAKFCMMHAARLSRKGNLGSAGYAKGGGHADYLGSDGYVLEFNSQHPAACSGRIRQHQRIFYDKHPADTPLICYWCGCNLRWDNFHVDHLDNDRSNNDPENLEASCETCNPQRGNMLSFMKRLLPERFQQISNMIHAERCDD